MMMTMVMMKPTIVLMSLGILPKTELAALTVMEMDIRIRVQIGTSLMVQTPFLYRVLLEVTSMEMDLRTNQISISPMIAP